MTVSAAIQLAGVEPAVMARWLESGVLPYRRNRKAVSIDRADVLDLMVRMGWISRPSG